MSEKQQMYAKPVVLNSAIHRTLKVRAVNDYTFAKGFNSCIIVGPEFMEVAKFYPIVFSVSNDVINPVAILGINSNLFVREDGRWEENTYIPAFIRRYPYILAEGLTQDGSLTVCIDSAYSGFNAEDGDRLFTDDGQNTPALNRAIEFLRQYHSQHEATKIFVSQVKGLDIFKPIEANIRLSSGEQFTVKNLTMIDEIALKKLPDSELAQLVRKGYLAWIYAHLYSLANFNRLIR